jgi:hypothetical protein
LLELSSHVTGLFYGFITSSNAGNGSKERKRFPVAIRRSKEKTAFRGTLPYLNCNFDTDSINIRPYDCTLNVIVLKKKDAIQEKGESSPEVTTIQVLLLLVEQKERRVPFFATDSNIDSKGKEVTSSQQPMKNAKGRKLAKDLISSLTYVVVYAGMV